MLLALTDDLPFAAVGGGEKHDATSVAAVRSYQERHGLDPTGAIDAPTLAEMSVPIEDRIRQIKINLERRRWQNRDLGADNVYVNLADNSVKLVHGGKSGRFVAVTNSEQLASLPTFFGSITGVRTVPGASPQIVLVGRLRPSSSRWAAMPRRQDAGDHRRGPAGRRSAFRPCRDRCDDRCAAGLGHAADGRLRHGRSSSTSPMSRHGRTVTVRCISAATCMAATPGWRSFLSSTDAQTYSL